MKTNDKAIATTIVIRPASEIRSFIECDEAGNVTLKAGSRLNADELAMVVVEDANHLASQSIRLVNTVRLARTLPVIKNGKDETQAIDYVLGKLKDECKTPSTYHNIVGLIECADIVDKNGLACSPFAVKESLGYLRKAGVLDDKLKLTNKADDVAKELKGGIGVNKVRDKVKAAKDKANAKAAKAGQTLPFPKSTGATPTPSVSTPAVEDTAEKIDLAIKALIDRVEKLQAKGDVDKARKVYVANVTTLAKLAGLVLVK